MWGRLNAPHHPQPRRGCRPSRHAIVPDVVLASKVEAIRNGIVVNCTLMLVVLAFQNKAIRNQSYPSCFQHQGCISLSKQGHPQRA